MRTRPGAFHEALLSRSSHDLRRLCQPGASRRQVNAAASTIAAALADTIDTTTMPSPPVLVPILRAGAAMLPGASETLDHPQVCFVRCTKDKTRRSVQVTFDSAAHLAPGSCILLDVVVARGDTIAAVIRHLHAAGYRGRTRLITCYAAPEGITHLLNIDADLQVHVGAYAHHVDPHGYLVPPTHGDMGNKLYGPIDEQGTEASPKYELSKSEPRTSDTFSSR